MKKIAVLFFLGFVFLGTGLVKAQSDDILYFCEKYDTNFGEVNTADRFIVGSLTVMVKLAYPILFTDVIIQLDKYNCDSESFEYFSDQPFSVNPDNSYIFFSGIQFDSPGMYRVFLLAPDRSTIVTGMVEIVLK